MSFDPLDMSFTAPQSEPPAAKPPSNLQLAIYDAIKDFSQHILVRARAGTGKTTTLINALEHAPGSTLLMAFNKDIADELKGRLPLGCDAQARTLNSLGHGLFWRYRRSAELNKYKTNEIVNALITDSEWRKEYSYAIRRTVGLMKANAFGLRGQFTQQDVAELVESYDMEIPLERLEWASEIAERAFWKSIEDKQSFDFDDQIYIPMLEGWKFPSFSNILVDEAQDLNPIQHLVIEQLSLYGARVVAVGDDRQAIYGFRGALSNSLEALKTKFSMRELPLNVSYRCALRIIERAQELCPDIQARPDAPLGELIELHDQRDPDFFGDQMVLCRNNAPLFRAILRYIRDKRPCRVRSNFIESFQGFIRGFKVESTNELLPKLDEWFAKESESASKKGFKGKLAGLQDKYETTKLLASEFRRVEEMLSVVKRLGESTSGTLFGTVHRVKGLEHESVHILRPDLIPSSFATTPEAVQQELNILYVAVTRAKSKLTFGATPF
jgi:DNA helicase-2/ATP-dependent DNA helicase PcrA